MRVKCRGPNRPARRGPRRHTALVASFIRHRDPHATTQDNRVLERIDPAIAGFSPQRLSRVSSWLREQIDSERLAGASVLVARRGRVALLDACGLADRELGKHFAEDTIVRIYSMTKAVTTVAAMMLYEEGAFQLDDPVSRYLPAFTHTPVWQGGDAPLDRTEPQARPITVRQLMTHTSGLTYGFMQANVVDAAYREAGIEFPGSNCTLAELVDRLAGLPLLCQPGSQWNYGVSTDVLGRLVEIWSGQSLAGFFAERIFAPLRMLDSGFHVAEPNHARFAALYAPGSGADLSNVGRTTRSARTATASGLKLQESSRQSPFLRAPTLYSGGGGLTSSIGDYARFCQMLLDRGTLDGNRLLGRKTVEYMRLNHLPDNRDMAAMGQPVWSETSYDGIGFGLGFAVVTDPVKASMVTSTGEHHWGGAASTFFWLDPQESLFVVFFTQLMPSSTYPIRRELRTRVYQALVD
ncbi:MAG: beta-lactamase family protein [Gammaproteobacteria bacterium]|nr:beta-lactamase family protein [Gammaproteobacteria bacterium]